MSLLLLISICFHSYLNHCNKYLQLSMMHLIGVHSHTPFASCMKVAEIMKEFQKGFMLMLHENKIKELLILKEFHDIKIKLK